MRLAGGAYYATWISLHIIGVQAVVGAAILGYMWVAGAAGACLTYLPGCKEKVADGAVQTQQQIVYRVLPKTGDALNGITARAVNAGNSAIGHVAGKIDSQWISTTKSFDWAVNTLKDRGVLV